MARLKPEARSVRVGGLAIHQLTVLPVSRVVAFFTELNFAKADEPIATPLLREIRGRLQFLCRVGVDYLSLDAPPIRSAAENCMGSPGYGHRLGAGRRLLRAR